MASALRAELAELAEARSQVDRRLRESAAPGGLGAGRGRGRRGVAAPPWQRAGAQTERALEQVGTRRPLLSSVVVPADGEVMDAEPAAREPEPTHEPTLKRPQRMEDDNPTAAKRNKRMFGALLGTLSKFREEEGANNRKEVVAKHTSSLQRAEEREREESKRLRELERGEVSEKRRSELLLRHRLAADMEEKQLRLGHLTWQETHACRAFFLVTQAAPPLFYLPAVLCPAADAALAARQAVCESEVEQAGDRLNAALASVAEAAAAREAELQGRPQGRDAAAVMEATEGEPLVLQGRPQADDAADEEPDEAADVDIAGLAGVLGVQDTPDMA